MLALLPAEKQREGERGEQKVRRRERVANEVWVKTVGDTKREWQTSPGKSEEDGGGEREAREGGREGERNYSVKSRRIVQW